MKYDLASDKNVEKDAFAESNEEIIDAEIVEEDEPDKCPVERSIALISEQS